MGIKQLYNDNLQKLPNEYGDVSVVQSLPQSEKQWDENVAPKFGLPRNLDVPPYGKDIAKISDP